MLGLSAICWVVWKARNKLCFEKKPVRAPMEIIFAACSFMRYWAWLYLEDTQSMISAGVETMMRVAMKIMKKGAQPRRDLMIGGRPARIIEEEDEDQADEVDVPGEDRE
jgi:hypothetical protein